LTATAQRQTDYVYLPGETDLPFAHTLGATTPTGIRYHEVDGLGNVIGTSQSGSASQTITYDVWGATTYAGNADQHLVWKGLFWNGDFSGLIFMRNRWYDPEGGRFVNEDPAGFHGGVNLYAFAGNDPINGSDPYGEWCFRQRVLGIKISVGYCNGPHSPGPLSHKLPPRAPVVAVSHQTAGLGDCLKNWRVIIACALAMNNPNDMMPKQIPPDQDPANRPGQIWEEPQPPISDIDLAPARLRRGVESLANALSKAPKVDPIALMPWGFLIFALVAF
jgi:RHS repeat-associated protein